MKCAVVRFPADSKLSGVVRASELQAPPTPMVSCGIAAVDALTGGLPRGALTEIFGPVSSGRTSLMLATLAAMTPRNEVCVLVDVTDAFDPHSAAAAGVNMDRLLWIRCGNSVSSFQFPVSRKPGEKTGKRKPETGNQALEQALKATDLLLQGGGFGLVIVDMGDVPPQLARRVPLTSWFRFRRAVEHTSTVLLVIEAEPYAKTCASLVLAVSHKPSAISGSIAGASEGLDEEQPAHARILQGVNIEMEVVRSRVQFPGATQPQGASSPERKPAQSARATFASKTEFAI